MKAVATATAFLSYYNITKLCFHVLCKILYAFSSGEGGPLAVDEEIILRVTFWLSNHLHSYPDVLVYLYTLR